MSTGQQVSLQVNGGQKITKKGLNLIIHHSTHLWHTCSGNYELFYILDFFTFFTISDIAYEDHGYYICIYANNWLPQCILTFLRNLHAICFLT